MMLEDELTVTTRDREGVAIIDLVGDVTTFAEEKINTAYREVQPLLLPEQWPPGPENQASWDRMMSRYRPVETETERRLKAVERELNRLGLD